MCEKTSSWTIFTKLIIIFYSFWSRTAWHLWRWCWGGACSTRLMTKVTSSMLITWRNRAATTRDIPISLYLFAHSLLRVAAFVCNYLTSFPGRLNNPTLFVFISLQIKYQFFYSNELLFRVKFHSSISILTTFVLSKVQKILC